MEGLNLELLRGLIYLLIKDWPDWEQKKRYYLGLLSFRKDEFESWASEHEKEIFSRIKAVATIQEYNSLADIANEIKLKKETYNISFQDTGKYIGDKKHNLAQNKTIRLKEETKKDFNAIDKKLIIEEKNKLIELFKSTRFEQAKKYFEEECRLISKFDYINLKHSYWRKRRQEIIGMLEAELEKSKYDEADQTYESNRSYMSPKFYLELVDKYKKITKEKLISTIVKEIKKLLRQKLFKEADSLARQNTSQIGPAEYVKIKSGYVYPFLKSALTFNLSDASALNATETILNIGCSIRPDFSFEQLSKFILHKFNGEALPGGLGRLVILEIAQQIDMGRFADHESAQKILRDDLKTCNKSESQRAAWKIICANPSWIETIPIAKDSLDLISQEFPIDKAGLIGPYYLPLESILIDNLVEVISSVSQDESLELRRIFKKHNYYNALCINAIKMASRAETTLRLDDILVLLKKIVDNLFDSIVSPQFKIPNLIFPKCISQKHRKAFDIDDEKNIFCEGSAHESKSAGKTIVMCRNNRCDIRTKKINLIDPAVNSVFLNFIADNTGVPLSKLYRSPQFSVALGALNRWNEISQRIVCGYGKSGGCGSKLTFFSPANIRQTGFAAYATTYWRCSDENCNQRAQEIKLSHCGGCGKIIDSRFDRIACPRTGDMSFYICTDCGYCCQQHGVSGHCPKCDKTKWVKLDQYGKHYRCENCGHEISVPVRHRGILGQNTVSFEANKEAARQKGNIHSHAKVIFEDIPF